MTKLKRITGKVFGGTATATGEDPQIAQFGSALEGTFIGTTDVETIQQLPAWGKGFINAVTPDTQFPALPEVTGLLKVLSHEICGILQQGISIYDSGTVYYTDNFCSKGGKIFVSLTDENQGNDPETSPTNWKEFTSGGGSSGIPIGTFMPFLIANDITPEGFIKPNNAEYTADLFLDLWNNYLQPNEAFGGKTYLDVCTYEEQRQDILTNGFSTRWAVNTATRTFKVPLLNDNYTAFAKTNLASTAPVKGNGITLGLTDGTSNFGIAPSNASGVAGLPITGTNVYGQPVGTKRVNPFASSMNSIGVTTDKTKSGLVADLSNVNPTGAKLKWFIYIANAQINQSAIDWNAYMSSLNNKADIDLSNLSEIGQSKLGIAIKTAYVNGTSGYNIYTNGYCEQWGLIVGGGDRVKTVSLLKTFKNTDYNFVFGFDTTNNNVYGSSLNAEYMTIKNKTVNSFAISVISQEASLSWVVRGYLAEGEY